MMANSALYSASTEADRKIQFQVDRLYWQTVMFIQTFPRKKKLHNECHSIAWAIHMVMPHLTLIHGIALGLKHTDADKTLDIHHCVHSWLQTPDGAIIDPYPPGCLINGVLLVPAKGVYAPFGGELYRPDRTILDTLNLKQTYRKATVLARIIRQAQAASSF